MDTLFNSIFEPLELEVYSFNYGVTTGILGYLLVKFIFERQNTMILNFMAIVFVFIFMDTLFNSIFEPLEIEVCSFNYGIYIGILGYLLVKLIFETYTTRNTMSLNFMTIVFVFIFMLPILIIYGHVRMKYQYCKKSST